MRGVFLDSESLRPEDLDLSALMATLPDWQLYPWTDPGSVIDRIAGAAVVVTNKVILDAATLARTDGVRLICVAATGTNNVDLAAASARGIAVCNVRAYATPSVVQHVFTLLLNILGHSFDYQKDVSQGRWQRSRQFCLLDHPIVELQGKRLGIVGFGTLGRAVARVAEAFGMEVLVAARPGAGPVPPERLPLEALLPRVDVLSLHCPLTPETRGLIGARELALMRPGAVLINTARGGIVDEPALAQALRSGHLAGAGVDVLSREPPLPDQPLLAGDIPHLILTPHIAWASRESRQRLVDGLVANIRAFQAGAPQNVVN